MFRKQYLGLRHRPKTIALSAAQRNGARRLLITMLHAMEHRMEQTEKRICFMPE